METLPIQPVGRPRMYKIPRTPEEIKAERVRKSKYVMHYRVTDNGRIKYNSYTRAWADNNRKRLNLKQNIRNRRKAAERAKKNIFIEIVKDDNYDNIHQFLINLSGAIKKGCIEKKTKGNNFKYINLMLAVKATPPIETLDERHFKILRKLTGWADIRKKNIDYEKMDVGALDLIEDS